MILLLASLCVAVASGIAAARLLGIRSGITHDLTRHARTLHGSQRRWLRQAGVPATPGKFAVISLGAGLTVFLVTWAVTGVWTVSVVPAILVAFLPRQWYRRQRAAHLTERQEAWPDAITDVIAALRSGATTHDALASLAITGPEALRPAFARYRSLTRTHDADTSLEIVREELADPTSDLVLDVLHLSMDRGSGEAVVVLEDVLDKVEEDLDNRRQIHADQLERRIEAAAVLVLPWLVLVFLVTSQEDFRTYYSSGAGIRVLAICAIVLEAGRRVVARLGALPVEPRVIGDDEPSRSASPVDIRVPSTRGGRA